MKNNKQYNHPSYGLIQFNKITGSSHCFMSDVDLGGYINLTVKRAELRRDLSRYWTYPREELLRLRLSYHQFAELITNMNSGCGIPCTLEWISNKGEGQVEQYINTKDERTEFEVELKETLDNRLANIKVETSAWIDNKLISMGMESLKDDNKFLNYDNS